ncbi:GAF domain-containing protein [Hoeflea sp.]|uniref:GAF domain-containing protein n=1 Tax=Hoeflea sp. TaxID=1940281 RepID=UPI003B0256DA
MERLDYPSVLVHAASGSHEALFALLAGRLQTSIGFELFTVLIADPSERQLRRIYSTDVTAYPPGLADRVEPSAWFDQLFRKKEPIVAKDREEIASWLPNYDGFEGTDFGALVNYPVVADDQTIGILNLTDRAGRYDPDTPARIASETVLCSMAISAFLSQSGRSGKD